MKPLPLIMSFLPLIAFSLLSKLLPHGDIGYAALVSAIFALVATVMHKPYWPPKILNATSFALFAVLAVSASPAAPGPTAGWPSGPAPVSA